MAALAAGRDGAWADARFRALCGLLAGAEAALLSLRVPDLAALMALEDALLARRLVELRCVWWAPKCVRFCVLVLNAHALFAQLLRACRRGRGAAGGAPAGAAAVRNARR
jgi:hypothetical protein